MIDGETVYVVERTVTGRDDYGAETYETTETAVDGVLVVPGGANDALDSNRPDAAQVSYTLHFPKAYTGDLTHADIRVRGTLCHVVGHPDRYTESNTPGRWNMPVDVEVIDG